MAVINKNKDSKNSSICHRQPLWLGEETAAFFATLHIPLDKKISDKIVIVCAPLGYEYTHSHRTLRHLCDHLASKGQPAIRFDYHGTGDSSGDLLHPNRIEAFQNNIKSVIEFSKNELAVEKVSLLGLRLGATFAAQFATNHSIDELILWAPCEKGRAYVREMRALDKLASHTNEEERNYIDSGGFILSDETAESLSQINLLKLDYQPIGRSLVIYRDDLSTSDKLLEHIKTTTESPPEKLIMSGYQAMMAEPQETIIPSQTICEISDWIVADMQNTRSNSTGIKLTQSCSFQWNEQLLEETVYHLGSKNLLAIQSKPKDFSANNQPTIILANSGSVHHVGPNRVYVEVARSLAAKNFNVVRLDLRNLGDSVQGFPANENTPYPAESTDDLQEAMDSLAKIDSSKKFILAGLCSGAHNVFHTGLELDDTSMISEVIMINPLAFYRRPHAYEDNSGQQEMARNKEQYMQSIFSVSKWKKLFSAESDVKYLISFVVDLLKEKLKNFTKIFSRQENTALSRDLLIYGKKSLLLSFIIASKDPGRTLLASQAKQTVERMQNKGEINILDVPEADHTFSTSTARSNFIRIISEHLIKTHSTNH